MYGDHYIRSEPGISQFTGASTYEDVKIDLSETIYRKILVNSRYVRTRQLTGSVLFQLCTKASIDPFDYMVQVHKAARNGSALRQTCSARVIDAHKSAGGSQ